MIFTAINVGRRLASRGRGASDEIGDSLREIGSSVDELLASADRALAQFTDGPRTRKAPIVIAGLAAAVGGYLVGRRAAASSGSTSGSGPVSSFGTAEATTAVASSRPQPPEAESTPVKAAQEAVGNAAKASASANRAAAKSNGEATGASRPAKPKSSGTAKAKSPAKTRAKKSSSGSRSTKAAPKRDETSKS